MGKRGSLMFTIENSFFGVVTLLIPNQYTKAPNDATGCSDNLLLL